MRRYRKPDPYFLLEFHGRIDGKNECRTVHLHDCSFNQVSFELGFVFNKNYKPLFGEKTVRSSLRIYEIVDRKKKYVKSGIIHGMNVLDAHDKFEKHLDIVCEK